MSGASMGFEDERVLITGSTRGIGRACAQAFLARGARVAVNGRTEAAVEAALAGLGSEATLAAPGDLATRAGCEAVVGAALTGLGGLDVLVNAAGVYRSGAATGFDEAEWDRILDVNLKGPFFCTMAALGALRQAKGNVVNVASVSGLMGHPDAAVYCASKGGLVNLTRALALELAPDVRVNCVCPGGVDTEMLRNDWAGSGDATTAMRESLAWHPMGRIATAEEVAEAILYLASETAGFVTGAALAIDGGASAGH